MDIMNYWVKAQQDLYDHVGFVEDWVAYAIDDRTDMFWTIGGNDEFVRYAEDINTLNSNGDFYEDEIYHQRFYPKWVYRGEKYTMIIVDTHTDGNKFFAFYDNEKEVKASIRRFDPE